MENGLTFIQRIREAFEGKEVDIRTYSPLTLAYIGDSIYDLVIRTVVVMRGNAPANKLHHYTIRYVTRAYRGRTGNPETWAQCEAVHES